MAKTQIKPMTEHPIVKKMTPALREVYKQIRPEYDGLVRRDMDGKYKIGQLVKKVQSAERKYGTGAVQLLGTALGVSADSLYDCARVAEHFSQFQFEQLRKRRNKGFRITFTHLVDVTEVKSHVLQAELIERTFKERLSTRDLAELIKNHQNPGQSSGSPCVRTPRGGLRSMICFANEFSKSREGLDEGLFEKIDTVKAKEVPEYLTLVKEAMATRERMIEDAQADLESLQEACRTLEARKADEKAKDRTPGTPTRKCPKKKAVVAA